MENKSELPDIGSRQDIERLLRLFYAKLWEDDLLGPVFRDIAQLDLEAHLPVIADFWEGILFGARQYKSNPMQVHMELNKKVNLGRHHFDRWLFHWQATLEMLFKGPQADEALSRARSIAAVMLHKLQA